MDKPQKRMQKAIVCSVYSNENDGKFSVELSIAAGWGKHQEDITAKIDYREWAVEQDVPACEPFRDFKGFCDACFNTDEKKQAFVDRNLEYPSGNLKSDYDETLSTVWNIHYNDGITRSMDYYWDTFLEECVDKLAEQLISKANDKGYILTKNDIIGCADHVPCLANVKDDTSANTPKKTTKDYFER